jgi:tetratricopeptide (TPR) repeat protein
MFIYDLEDSLIAMRRCELCGAENAADAETCSRCGFEFRTEILADSRNEALLDRHRGKAVRVVRRELKNKRSRLMAYLENLDAKRLSTEEIVTLVNDSLAFLQIPLEMDVEDGLAFDAEESAFIERMAEALEKLDSCGSPAAAPGTYVRLSNALHFLGQQDRAIQMADRALLINPRDGSALLAKASLLFSQRRYAQAKRCLEKLLAEREDDRARCLLDLIEQMA